MQLKIKRKILWQKKVLWVDWWVGGWEGAKASLRITCSNQKGVAPTINLYKIDPGFVWIYNYLIEKLGVLCSSPQLIQWKEQRQACHLQPDSEWKSTQRRRLPEKSQSERKKTKSFRFIQTTLGNPDYFRQKQTLQLKVEDSKELPCPWLSFLVLLTDFI